MTPKDPNNRAKKEEPSTAQPVSKELDKNGTETNLEKKGNIISNLIGRLSMKSKNQMKLPDDKNKTVSTNTFRLLNQAKYVKYNVFFDNLEKKVLFS